MPHIPFRLPSRVWRPADTSPFRASSIMPVRRFFNDYSASKKFEFGRIAQGDSAYSLGHNSLTRGLLLGWNDSLLNSQDLTPP